MAVAFDAKGTASKYTASPAGANINFTNLTIGSISNGVILASLSYFATSSQAGSISVTWDQGGTNLALTLIGEFQTSAQTIRWVSLWGAVAPVSGNKTLQFTTTASMQEVTVDAISLSGASQAGGTSTFAHFNSARSTSSTASVTITSASSNMVVAAMVCASAADSTWSSVNNTQFYIDNTSGTTPAAGNYAIGAASVSMQGTLSLSTREWAIVGVDVVAVAGPIPFLQMDWPNPRGAIPEYPVSLRTWADRRVHMMGLDRLPFRQMDWPLQRPVWDNFPIAFRTWAWRQLHMQGQDKLPFNQDDWPLPNPGKEYGVLLRTWTDCRIHMLGKDRLPFRQMDWPIPEFYRNEFPRYLRSWTDRRVHMMGQDKLPFRQMDWPNPRGAIPEYPVQLRTWTSFTGQWLPPTPPGGILVYGFVII